VELENIILSEDRQVQKGKGHMISLTCGRQTQYKCKHYHYTYKYIQNMLPKVGQLEETKGGGNEGKNDKKMNNKEIYHICVEQDTTKHTENCQTTQNWEKGEEE
jgi:hypothetical protein